MYLYMHDSQAAHHGHARCVQILIAAGAYPHNARALAASDSAGHAEVHAVLDIFERNAVNAAVTDAAVSGESVVVSAPARLSGM